MERMQETNQTPNGLSQETTKKRKALPAENKGNAKQRNFFGETQSKKTQMIPQKKQNWDLKAPPRGSETKNSEAVTCQILTGRAGQRAKEHSEQRTPNMASDNPRVEKDG